MPRLGGATLVARLRQDPEWTRFADLPIVIVSGLWDGASGEGAGVDRCARQDVLARLGK
jgi:CheY-like chemotaxis protein